MKKDIILAGVGGQGILSMAAIIGTAALDMGLYLKQSEVHGMSQRGGDVSSHLRISSVDIASDLIPGGKADMVISIEPMEGLRYLPMLSNEGWLITNDKPFNNIATYPEIEDIYAEIAKTPRHIMLNAELIAKEAGTTRAANVVILGAASFHLGIEYVKFEDAIRKIFGRKGDAIVDFNLKALRAGRDYAENYKNN
ncbi:MAG: indolepyruvate oxidoreductase subunit beta [Bacteroidota bacterium]